MNKWLSVLITSAYIGQPYSLHKVKYSSLFFVVLSLLGDVYICNVSVIAWLMLTDVVESISIKRYHNFLKLKKFELSFCDHKETIY